MKKIHKLIGIAVFFGVISCNDFEDINIDPKAVRTEDQIRVEYSLNEAITQAQMNPDVAERSFVLYWKTAGRQHMSNGLSIGTYDAGWNEAYYNQSSEWLKAANIAIELADYKIAKGIPIAYDAKMIPNMREVARIWRAYLMSELCDNFGPIPLPEQAFQGQNPDFSDVKTVYYFILAELKDAVANLDTKVTPESSDKRYDRFYGFDFSKWVKYANSLRMRLAMRLSEVDPIKAQTEFEDAVKGSFITVEGDIAKCNERPGWDALTGVMSREWNAQLLSATLNNLMLNLGGIPTNQQLDTKYLPYIKPANYMGVRYENHYSLYTNDPSAGFFFDGLPNTIDPRAYRLFVAPGDFKNSEFCFYPSYNDAATTVKRALLNEDKKTTLDSIDASFTWNASPIGSYGEKSPLNQVYSWTGTNPRLALSYRNSTNSRVFFAHWESYFLIAEAAVRGWATPIPAQEAYEKGIRASFMYNDGSKDMNLTKFIDAYLASTSYNRAGTSVNWNHTTEPPATVDMTMINGYTKQPANYTFKYPIPSNNLYTKALNDQLTKIITQKFIANTPWLPLESWSDHRRLGLPFFEVPCVENPMVNMPALNRENCMKANIKFYPQRLKYPASFADNNSVGYTKAKQLLGGDDAVLTPLWWAKKQ